MAEDMSFGDWSGVTPHSMKSYSEAKLHYAMEQNRGGVYDAWARAELSRRQNERLGELIKTLREATSQVQTEVVTLGKSSANLESLTGKLIGETEKVHREVAILSDSSNRMENLTKKLKRFTFWLIVFAGIQIAVAGIQTWKMFQPERPISVIVQSPPAK